MLSDTSKRIDDLVTARLSSMSLEQRVMQFINLNISARAMVLAGIKSRHPMASDLEVKKRAAAILLGSDFAKKHYNWDTEIEGY